MEVDAQAAPGNLSHSWEQDTPWGYGRHADRAARAGRHMGTGHWHTLRMTQTDRQAGSEGPGQEELQRPVVRGSSRSCCAGRAPWCVPQPLFPGAGVSGWMSLAFPLLSPLWLDPDCRQQLLSLLGPHLEQLPSFIDSYVPLAALQTCRENYGEGSFLNVEC